MEGKAVVHTPDVPIMPYSERQQAYVLMAILPGPVFEVPDIEPDDLPAGCWVSA